MWKKILCDQFKAVICLKVKNNWESMRVYRRNGNSQNGRWVGGGGSLSKSGGCENFMLQVDFFFSICGVSFGGMQIVCVCKTK